MERVFDICHGCRRCVSLCNTFCYLCDLCYVVKCPYVPPHPWNVDFPHLMLRATSYQFEEGKMQHPVRDRALV